MENEQRLLEDVTCTVALVKSDRGFGFLIFTTSSGRKIRIFFHFRDSDKTEFQVGDIVLCNIGPGRDEQPAAYNVRFISSKPVQEKP